MKVPCKNSQCRYFYQLRAGEHCAGEDTCEGYTNNRKKADKNRIHCKECMYCKVIYTDQGKAYHYECMYNNRRKVLLLVEERRCDCKK